LRNFIWKLETRKRGEKAAKCMCKIEKINRAYLAYNPNHIGCIREYYLFCVELFKKSFSNLDSSINVIFGEYNVNFPNHNRILKIDIQWEHTLVKPDGRDSAEAIIGKIPVKDSSNFYLVRINNYNYLKTLNLIIEYSIPNITNLRECGIFNDYLNKTIYLAPFIYDIDFGSKERSGGIITLFFDCNQPRRKIFLNRIQGLGVPLTNERDCFDKIKLKQLFKNTKILVNIHQTDHHHTFEELRILPVLLCGVIIISEDVPLKESIPYSKFIIWSSYENILDTVRSVYASYDHYYNKIFNNPDLLDILIKMKKNNIDNVDTAVHKLLCANESGDYSGDQKLNINE